MAGGDASMDRIGGAGFRHTTPVGGWRVVANRDGDGVTGLAGDDEIATVEGTVIFGGGAAVTRAVGT